MHTESLLSQGIEKVPVLKRQEKRRKKTEKKQIRATVRHQLQICEQDLEHRPSKCCVPGIVRGGAALEVSLAFPYQLEHTRL